MTYTVTTAVDIADKLKEIIKQNQALTTVIISGQGYEVGIATEGERGYSPTALKFESGTKWNDAESVTTGANKILFPDRKPIDNYQIVLSSHRK